MTLNLLFHLPASLDENSMVLLNFWDAENDCLSVYCLGVFFEGILPRCYCYGTQISGSRTLG